MKWRMEMNEQEDRKEREETILINEFSECSSFANSNKRPLHNFVCASHVKHISKSIETFIITPNEEQWVYEGHLQCETIYQQQQQPITITECSLISYKTETKHSNTNYREASLTNAIDEQPN